MKVLFVDANKQTIEKMEIKNNINTFYELIGTDCVEIIGRKINGKMTEIILDEEGKLKEHQYISGLSEEMNENLVGNLIIKSNDDKIIDLYERYGVLVYSTKR